MKKMLDLVVVENIQLNHNYSFLKLTTIDGCILPEMKPGQFVQVLVSDSPRTFLRRPISVNYVDVTNNQLWLLVQAVGEGTKRMSQYKKGENVNMLLPLGNTFTLPEDIHSNILLIGGGVGTAPMLFLGSVLKNKGYNPKFLLGARSESYLMQLDEFAKYGEIYTSTEDGTYGESGFVTQHTILESCEIDKIYTCGPKLMMMAVAFIAHQKNIECEVSLENTMACGFGACLCCVEDTKKGNLCVCTEGPVFNINELKWID